MTNFRTDDTSYGKDYWNSLDGGRGYRDSLLWSDIAFILHELFGVDQERDIAPEVGVMDIGCAYGYLIRHLRKRGFDCRGVDFSEYALKHAPQDVKPYLTQLDIRSGQRWTDRWEKRSRFELVTCFETLEHVPEDSMAQALHQIRQMMTRNGTFVATICTDQQPGWESDPTHVTIRSREWWEKTLAVAGFSVVPELVAGLKTFHLFRYHDGVFVCLQG